MLAACSSVPRSGSLPEGFVFLTDVDPSVTESVAYATARNFTGRPVPGYTTSRVVCTRKAAEQLKKVLDELKAQGFGLVVYDGYRPQRAVDAFKVWSLDPDDQVMKGMYYPTINKSDAFRLGYIAERSSHSRGSTFDLTLIRAGQKLKPLHPRPRKLSDGSTVMVLDDGTVDMGSSFDLFHPVSHHDSPLVAGEAKAMRDLLRDTMVKHGFIPYSEEWWHYTLNDEPFPETFHDFVVEGSALVCSAGLRASGVRPGG